MKKFILIFVYLLLHISFTCLTRGQVYSQSGQVLQSPYHQLFARTSNYLPQYNLWLTGNTINHSNTIQQINLKKFGIDSIFYWQVVHTPFPYSFGDIYFIDSLHGWITHGNGGVLRTTDSGFNWDITQLVNGVGPIEGVYFINRDTGWAVGITGIIRKTTNGGINWLNQDWPTDNSAYYYSIHFFDANTGIITGIKTTAFSSYGYVIKTINGGSTWTELYIDTVEQTNLVNQYWIDTNYGWICGYNRLLKTTNGGNSFINYFSSIPPISNGHNGLEAIFLIDKNTGWLCGSNIDHKNIYKTTNEGNDWIFQDNPASQNQFSQINDIKFISQDTGWATYGIPGFGYILFTSNGRTNWIIDNKNPDEYVKLSIYKKSKIWCTAPGKVWFTLLTIPIGIVDLHQRIPNNFNLHQNYPNPFNPVTKIKYDLPTNTNVTIKIYDIIGREVAVLINNEYKEAGTYQIEWNGTNFASGVYFYRIEAGQYTSVKKMVILK